MFTRNSTFLDVKNEALFADYMDVILGPGCTVSDEQTLETFGQLGGSDDIKSVHGGLNALLETFRQGERPIWLWGEEHRQVALFPFLVGDGKPFAVVCPGGGYSSCVTLAEGFPVAAALNAMGFNAFVLTYRVGDDARYPAPQDDLAQAVKYILNHSDDLQVAHDNYSVWGFSAGGHLVASFGTKNMGFAKYKLPAPAALILSYPVITMGTFAHVGSRSNLLGPECTRGDIKRASVECQIDSHYPSTFIWTCRHDGAVPFENSRMLKERLSDIGVRHRLKVFSGTAHGWSLAVGKEAESWFAQAIAFWRSTMK